MEPVEIFCWHEEKPETTTKDFRDESSALLCLRQFMTDHFTMASFRDFLAEETHCPDISRMSDQEVLEQIARRLVCGTVSITLLPMQAPLVLDSGSAPEENLKAQTAPTLVESPAPASEDEDEVKTSWIEIELVGEDNQPIPGERYEIMLPTGKTVAKGWLDARGFARETGFEKGTCQVRFPDLDREAWEKI